LLSQKEAKQCAEDCNVKKTMAVNCPFVIAIKSNQNVVNIEY